MKNFKIWMLALASFNVGVAFAQDDVRISSSNYLKTNAKTDVTIPFLFASEGKRFSPTWGLDLAWINEQNVRKGVNHMGKDNVGIGRISFRVLNPLKDDGSLTTDQIQGLQTRSNIFNRLVGQTLPLVINCDNGYMPDGYTGPYINTYYTANKRADADHWAKCIVAHVNWMKNNTSHPIVGVSPFNEPDNALEKNLVGEIQGTPEDEANVARVLKTYDLMQGIVITGGNTLNDDNALNWYNIGKQYYDWGNTHQLAGSFDNYANFFQQLQQEGKVGYADEMHNVGEAMIGLEYGMTVGTWWGFDSRARGEFCDITRHGERLAYAEHRNNWTSAAVYRHDDGRVKAFFGSSERQANTTSYRVLSVDRDVYFDGRGPLREYSLTLKGANGYSKGQTNVERVIDITWGEDVQPAMIDGTYQIVNYMSGGVLAYTSNGSQMVLQPYTGAAKQLWDVHPTTQRTSGDISFYDIEASDNRNVRPNVENYSTTASAKVIAWTQDAPTTNEQWYMEYAGDGCFLIRNRESALCLTASNNSNTAKIQQSNLFPEGTDARKRQLWRILPADVTFDKVAPSKPNGLTVTPASASVKLEWETNAEVDLDGYMVVRTEKGSDLWNTIARKVKVNHFVDNNCIQGHIYIYKVKAIDKAENQSEGSDPVEAMPSGERSLVAQWLMDGNLYDETANMMDAVCSTTASYVTGHDSEGKAVTMTNRYLQLPYEVANSDELTIAMWVRSTSTATWQRLFDFGHDTDHYMFLTPNNGATSVMRFTIKNGGSEQTVDCNAKLPVSVDKWNHVAVTIGQGNVCIYQNGELVGSGTGITIKPSDIHPVINYLGRSRFNSDPYFSGHLDDVRIYNFAMTADEVKGVMDNTLNGIQTPQTDASPSLSIYGMDGRQLTAPKAGINIIDGKKVLIKP